MSIRHLRALVTFTSACAALSAFAACDNDSTKTGISNDASGDSSIGNDSTGSTDSTVGPSDVQTGIDTTASADPLCDEGNYTEALPDDKADLSGLIGAYTPSEYKPFIAAVLGARYPVGASLVADGLRLGTQIGDCVDLFLRAKDSGGAVIGQLSTFVHECGHFLDIAKGGFSSSYFQIVQDQSFSCPRLGNALARSEINNDDYSALFAGDSYKDVYLDGDPNNASFEGGDQGFDSVLEETTQYVNSLATDWAFRDNIRSGSSISARDGILTFLWYTMRYLRVARTGNPTTYEAIRDNSCWREAILTVWARAWFYLELTDGISSLGIRDARLLELATDPSLLSEIAALRTAQGCDAP